MFATFFVTLALAATLLPVAMAEDYLGEIRLYAHNRLPGGWMRCEGQILSIQQNTALFALLGVTYGGNGVSTFALPNMRERFPRGVPNAGLLGEMSGGFSQRAVGTAAGSISIDVNNLPPHSHSATFAGSTTSSSFTCDMPVKDTFGTQQPVAGGFLSRSSGGMGLANIYQGPDATGDQILIKGGSGSVSFTAAGSITVDQTGAGQPVAANLGVTVDVPYVPPSYLNLNYIICVQGIFPSGD